MNTQQCDVVIIGGGISGLCVAHWLTKHNVNVMVLEKDAEVGGTMKSVNENGFLVETGPNSALETTPLIKELVADCNLEDEFLYASPTSKNRYILRDGKLQVLPLNPIAFLKTGLFSASAKLRLLKEPLIGRANREESIAEFVTRRLGQEFLDYAIDPFVAGVFAGRPEKLSVRAAFPKLFALEEKYGGLIKGMILGRKERKARAEKAKDRAESFSFRSGMQALPQAIAKQLGNKVVTRASVNSFQKNSSPMQQLGGRRFVVEYSREGAIGQILTNFVVLSVPAYAAAGLVRQYSSSTAATLESIYYPPVISVYAGFDQTAIAEPLDGFGFLIPTKEKRDILGCLWSSSLFSGRAPKGMVSLTA
ncbi:MAG: protoporphyrinogen oxidase, partial [Ignavibacteriales bacterium]|nr:protoporphyrinogen oxidase [Ignavibacteriales bacterium]